MLQSDLIAYLMPLAIVLCGWLARLTDTTPKE